MRIRSAFALIFVAALLSGCANVAGPMECESNPKCKADLQPIVPNQLKLTIGAAPTVRHVSPAGSSTRSKIGSNR